MITSLERMSWSRTALNHLVIKKERRDLKNFYGFRILKSVKINLTTTPLLEVLVKTKSQLSHGMESDAQLLETEVKVVYGFRIWFRQSDITRVAVRRTT